MDSVKSQKHSRLKLSRFRRHPKEGYSVQASVWIEKDGELYVGGGRALLLENIEKHGSLAAAARVMNVTYRNAWLWVDAMNRLAPSPLVEKTAGGAGGGYCRITDEGRQAIARYRALRSELAAIIADE
ncbi:MAG: LysR family transcriptional regulator [Dehalococcoidia bacterium]|nr:LysR family transcriptional regulator [Dehalococcoidia bacterium]